MQAPMIFSFEDLDNGTAAKKIKEFFAHAGADAIEVNVDARLRRTSGVSYRTVSIVFADGQTVGLAVKQTGDVYQATLNGKAVPIRAQESEADAALELVKLMDAGRSKFQAALARTKTVMPASIKTPVPKQEVLLKQQHDDLDRAIEAAHEEIAGLNKQLADLPVLDGAGYNDDPKPATQDLGDHQNADVTIERPDMDGHGKDPNYGERGPVPEKTESVAENDTQEQYEDRAQQYDLSKRDPVKTEADRAIAANEQQAAASNSTTSPNAGKQGDDDKNTELAVSAYY